MFILYTKYAHKYAVSIPFKINSNAFLQYPCMLSMTSVRHKK